MEAILTKHKLLWVEKEFLLAVAGGFVLLAVSLYANTLANAYTVTHISNSVTDILLDNLPVINVDFVFSEGAMIFLALLALILAYEPKYTPFTLKAIALFVLIRSAFMMLTHLAPPPHASPVDPTDLINKLSYGDDLFFSAHTGLPFMLAFVFWRRKMLRYFFFAVTAVGATAVILGHLHYSIDVFSALFIAFGIFHISKNLFPKDYETIHSERLSGRAV